MSETTATVKSPSVAGEVFVSAFVAGVKAGKSNKEIAASIGMKPATFNVRVSQLRKQAKEAKAADANFVSPFDSLPARSRSTVNQLELLRAKIAEVDGASAPTGEGEVSAS